MLKFYIIVAQVKCIAIFVLYLLLNTTKKTIMIYKFDTNIENSERYSILEQCMELYTSKDFDFTLGGGSINGIKAFCPEVELFCLCNGLSK